MNPFQYVRPAQPQAALDAIAKAPTARFIAGGTNLLDLMKHDILTPERLVDITRLPLREIHSSKGGLRIGALASNRQVAEDPQVVKHYPLLSQALLAGASAQLRNMATVGGNLMQRTRCPYFYDTAFPCNKRAPGSGCGAREGLNRTHAIFGWSEQCIAVHPSDMCVALAALDATVVVVGPKGERRIPFGDFHRLPGDHPDVDTTLQSNELITAVDLPESAFAEHAHYLKVRERSSYAFALVSVAAALSLDGDTIQDARLALGGVAHKPWRLNAAEQSLRGKPISEATFRQAADVAMQGAKAFEHNAYKMKMTPQSIVQALKTAAGLA
ncbi:xanthine dehydrogenase YagS FAD-binding subunit [Catalinimonas alkaloidigena]|uniref:Xanthine dehydrogenase YagS FAD-binding subunit n=1 Tax=Catalinimonas alkaloidigena TaxID=1075417 RepID=A0A1G8ZYD1_9BACT|nr:xanthine dehydrogenase family protein subunit M [Catalinimonas alkaloidigena]SDK19991.1 xanthine dehydrogenase YagS FAD-binding subunit [Catalinimonas alkaloidigena]